MQLCATPFLAPILAARPGSRPSVITSDQFARWIIGFIDGEGNFQVYFDRDYLRVIFRIRLHIDDIAILHAIQKYLGVGRVTTDNNTCVFTVSNMRELTDILIPFVLGHKLFTSKWLDFLDFQEAVALLASREGTTVLGEERIRMNTLIQSINSTRVSYDLSLMPTPVIDPYYLLGFVEAEGTFGLKSLAPYFSVAQHSRNRALIDAIREFLQSLPNLYPESGLVTGVVSSMSLKSTGVLVLEVSDVDALFSHVLPFFLSLEFQARKGVDFYL